MRALQAIANKARVSLLGSLGQGAAGGVTNNSLSQTNAAPIPPATSARWDSSPLTLTTPSVYIAASMTLSKNGGTLAAGDEVTFQLVRDTGGGTVAVGGHIRVTATADGGDVIATGGLAWIDTSVAPGTTHTYGIRATITGGVHTGGILINEAQVTVFNV